MDRKEAEENQNIDLSTFVRDIALPFFLQKNDFKYRFNPYVKVYRLTAEELHKWCPQSKREKNQLNSSGLKAFKITG